LFIQLLACCKGEDGCLLGCIAVTNYYWDDQIKNEMDGEHIMHEEIRYAYQILYEKPEGKLQDLGIDGKIMIKWNKQNGMTWSGFMCLKTGTSVGLLQTWYRRTFWFHEGDAGIS
jgi:hypothetical protein